MGKRRIGRLAAGAAGLLLLVSRPVEAQTPTPAGTPVLPPAGTVTPTPVRTAVPTGTPTTPGLVTTQTPAPSAASERPAPFTATLIGLAEVPGPGEALGLGSAAISVDPVVRTVCYALHVVNIAPPTAAHIHEGSVAEAGPVVVPLEVPTDGDARGCVSGVDAALLTRLLQTPAAFYVNVHNAEFPDGAVRGQLGP